MIWLVLAAAVLAVYVVGVWGGGMLASHYADLQETAAALGVALALMIPIILASRAGAMVAVVPLVAAACGVGLFVGYDRVRR